MLKSFDVSKFSYQVLVFGAGTLALIFMIGPVFIGLLMSFTAGETLRFPPEGLSLRWYAALLDPVQSAPLHTAATTSAIIALCTVVGSMLFAVPAALGSPRVSGWMAGVVELLLLSPLVLPTVVYGIAALIAATAVGLRTSPYLLISGHVVVFAPLLYRATIAVTASLDKSLEEASATLGVGPIRTFWRIIAPLIAPGAVAGGFLVFMQSFDNVSITLFLADPATSTLPRRLWSMIESTLDARVGAVAGFLIIITLVLLLLVQRVAPVWRARGA